MQRVRSGKVSTASRRGFTPLFLTNASFLVIATTGQAVDSAAGMAHDRPAQTPGAPGFGNRITWVFSMHEFAVLATFAVIAAIYVGVFLAAEKYFMK
jgi:hypothetical protein